MISRLSRWPISSLLLLGGLSLAASLPADEAEPSRPAGVEAAATETASRAALHDAVDKNLDYCVDWLDGKDFETLEQTAGGVLLLSDALARRGDADTWQRQLGQLTGAVNQLTAAADEEDGAAAREAIAAIRRQNEALRKLRPAGKPLAARPPAAGLKLMMPLLEGTYTDAKAALTFGEVDNAKSRALVLAELGWLVSNYRKDAAWREAATALSSAAQGVAQSEATEAKAVREALRGVYTKCEACHNRNR